MDVFLIPVAADRYELYCEVPDEDPSGPVPDHDRRWFRGVVRRFRGTLAELERERNAGVPPLARTGLVPRLRAKFRRFIAETVAEQRLLWHMRRQSAARIVHPSDLDPPHVMPIVRAQFDGDYRKHRLWLVVNALLFVASGLLTLLPGPNLVAYYFAFRLAGHWLSIRGARQALRVVTWTTEPSGPLADLRALSRVGRAERRPGVEAIANALELQHLTRFFDRIAIPGA
jgi:Mitochondrial K+-H+ exchange-related